MIDSTAPAPQPFAETDADTVATGAAVPHTTVCPLLGCFDDRGRTYSRPVGVHRCYASGRRQEVSTAQQREACLTERFPTCPHFVAAGALPLSASATTGAEAESPAATAAADGPDSADAGTAASAGHVVAVQVETVGATRGVTQDAYPSDHAPADAPAAVPPVYQVYQTSHGIRRPVLLGTGLLVALVLIGSTWVFARARSRGVAGATASQDSGDRGGLARGANAPTPNPDAGAAGQTGETGLTPTAVPPGYATAVVVAGILGSRSTLPTISADDGGLVLVLSDSPRVDVAPQPARPPAPSAPASGTRSDARPRDASQQVEPAGGAVTPTESPIDPPQEGQASAADTSVPAFRVPEAPAPAAAARPTAASDGAAAGALAQTNVAAVPTNTPVPPATPAASETPVPKAASNDTAGSQQAPAATATPASLAFLSQVGAAESEPTPSPTSTRVSTPTSQPPSATSTHSSRSAQTATARALTAAAAPPRATSAATSAPAGTSSPSRTRAPAATQTMAATAAAQASSTPAPASHAPVPPPLPPPPAVAPPPPGHSGDGRSNNDSDDDDNRRSNNDSRTGNRRECLQSVICGGRVWDDRSTA